LNCRTQERSAVPPKAVRADLTQRTPFDRLRAGSLNAEETGNSGEGVVAIKAMFFTTRSSLTTGM